MRIKHSEFEAIGFLEPKTGTPVGSGESYLYEKATTEGRLQLNYREEHGVEMAHLSLCDPYRELAKGEVKTANDVVGLYP